LTPERTRPYNGCSFKGKVLNIRHGHRSVGTSKLGLEVFYVIDNAPAFQQGAQKNAWVPGTDEVEGRAPDAGPPQG